MLLAGALHQRRARILAVVAIICFITVVLFHPYTGPEIFDRVSDLKSNLPSLSTPSPSDGPFPADKQALSLPDEYESGPDRGSICADRFTKHYFEDFRDHAIGYCAPGVRGNLTCFHTANRSDRKKDSMCFVQGVDFDTEKKKFNLNCHIRSLSVDEQQSGLVPFNAIQAYWYDTGPPQVFARALNIHDPGRDKPATRSLTTQTEVEVENQEQEENHGQEGDDTTDASTAVEPQKPPRNFLLLKREGEGNIWHCMMEIMSTWMSFDVLRMASDPSNNGQPFFKAPEDVADTQVIILDERTDGPYFDLWTLFASRKPMRLHELADKPEMAAAIQDANLIVPLAGSSNPLWQDDWEADQCSSTPSVSVFSDRVLEFYDIPEAAPRKKESPIKVTFIDRTSSRRLLNQSAMFEALKERNKHIELTVIDFAEISFQEQLRLVRDTDVLVGVHGAGLTHALFMREYNGAVVEIQPHDMNFHVFRNIILLRGLGYFRVHGQSVEPQKRSLDKRDWHFRDVQLETDRFVDVVDTAVKSLYGNGAWDFDVNLKDH